MFVSGSFFKFIWSRPNLLSSHFFEITCSVALSFLKTISCYSLLNQFFVHFLGCLKMLDLLGTGCCGFKLFVAYVANIINYTYVLLCFYSSPYFETMLYFHIQNLQSSLIRRLTHPYLHVHFHTLQNAIL